MASEIRVNKINSRTGVGTITLSPTGVDFTGIATVATLKATAGIVTTLTVTGNGTVGGTLNLGDNNKLLLGDNDDLQIYHDGSTSIVDGRFHPIELRHQSEVHVKCVDDGAVELYHNNSKKLETTSDGITVSGNVTTDGLRLGDSEYAYFGTGNDLSIYHDGSHSYIDDQGTGNLILESNGGEIKLQTSNGSEDLARFINNGAVELFHDGTKKFETTNIGATLTGTFNVGSGTSITSSSLIVNDVQYPTAGALSDRNLVINGAMRVAQRGTSSTSNGYQTVDRMRPEGGVISVTQSQQTLSSGSPYDEGFRYFMRGAVTSTSSATNTYFQIENRIEAQDIAQSGWKYKDSSTNIIASFWARSSLAGTYYVQYRALDSGSGLFYINKSFTLAADTWTKIEHVIPGHSSLVFNNDTGNGFQITIVPHYGTDYTDSGVAVDSWFTRSGDNYLPDFAQNWGNTSSATFDVTGLQLEVGSKATPFEHRSFGDELTRCQRYFQKSYNYSDAPGSATSTGTSWMTIAQGGGRIAHTAYLKVKMRATPTFKTYDWAGNIDKIRTGSGNNQNASAIYSSETAVIVDVNVSGVTENIFQYTAEAEL